MGIFSGLEKLGLSVKADMEVYDKPDEKKKAAEGEKKQEPVGIKEEDVVFERKRDCPVCNRSFTSKAIRTGKVRLASVDSDLRPKYHGVDCLKYDCIACPLCGYSALAKYFDNISVAQAKLIKDEITPEFNGFDVEGPIYSYDDAILRYQLALANAVVKKSKNGERGYICLKLAWVLRGKAESLDIADANYEKEKQELAKDEAECLKNAYEGFKLAMTKEMFPICGMDEWTFTYVTAELARRCKDYNNSMKLVSSIIVSKSASTRVKDKARDLKEEIKKEVAAAAKQ